MIHIWIPILPPSSNNIYVNRPGGKGRVLSQKARTFKVRAMQTIQKEGRVAFLNLKEGIPYELKICVFFEAVVNKGFPDKAKSRFKKIDIGNRLKLIEDSVADALGLDDCHNFRIVLEKHCDPATPGLYIDVKEVPEDEVSLTKEEYDARHLSPRDVPVFWRSVTNHPDYEVSNIGLVRRGEKLLSLAPTEAGYLQVCLCCEGRQTTAHVHSLVAEAFLGPRPANLEVDHKDGVKTNNHVRNLEYVTKSENMKRAYALGIHSGNRALDDDQIAEIKRMAQKRIPQREIATKFNISQNAVSLLLLGKTYGGKGILEERNDGRKRDRVRENKRDRTRRSVSPAWLSSSTHRSRKR